MTRTLRMCLVTQRCSCSIVVAHSKREVIAKLVAGRPLVQAMAAAAAAPAQNASAMNCFDHWTWLGHVPREMQWACWTSSEPGARFWTDTGYQSFRSTSQRDPEQAPETPVLKQELREDDIPRARPDNEDPEQEAMDEDEFPELILPLLDEDLVPLHLLDLRALIIAEEKDTRPVCRWCHQRQQGHGRGWCRSRQCRQCERSWRSHMRRLRSAWRSRHFMRQRGPMPKLRALPDDVRRRLESLPADGTFGGK